MQIKHSRARIAAKKLLGDTNHLLITLLIGVEGVRTGKVVKDDSFNVVPLHFRGLSMHSMPI
jgi:hypothetical protein